MKKYEIGNNEVQEVLNTPPKFFVFWGTSIIAVVFIIISYFLLNYSITITNTSLYNNIKYEGINNMRQAKIELTVNPDDREIVLLADKVELLMPEHFKDYKIELKKIQNRNGKLYINLSSKILNNNNCLQNSKQKAHVNLIIHITLLDYLLN